MLTCWSVVGPLAPLLSIPIYYYKSVIIERINITSLYARFYTPITFFHTFMLFTPHTTIYYTPLLHLPLGLTVYDYEAVLHGCLLLTLFDFLPLYTHVATTLPATPALLPMRYYHHTYTHTPHTFATGETVPFAQPNVDKKKEAPVGYV